MAGGIAPFPVGKAKSAVGGIVPYPVGKANSAGAVGPASAKPRSSLLFDADHYLVCFGAVAQGDHLGVELGSAAHSSLLESAGLLGHGDRLCSNRPSKGTVSAQGLVIDVFFSVTVKRLRDPKPPQCLDHLQTAKDTYTREGLLGSDDKDINGEDFARIAGAEVNSTRAVRALGLCTVASPAAKRIALCAVSLETARFSQVTDSLLLWLVGSWTSAALIRRPLMSVFSAVYAVRPSATVKPSRPTLRWLPRAAAQELALFSVPSPLACCDLAAPFGDQLYATDASEEKGGFVIAEAEVSLLRPLWWDSFKKERL